MASGEQQPKLRDGDDTYCEFDTPHLAGLGQAYIARMEAILKQYREDVRGIPFNPKNNLERVDANAVARQAFENCCSELMSYQKELRRRMPLLSRMDDMELQPLANPTGWFDKDDHDADIEQGIRALGSEIGELRSAASGR